MTYQEFLASKRWSDDLAAEVGDQFGTEEKVSGWLYADSFFINDARYSGYQGEHGHWMLVLMNNDWLSDDLSELERILWDDFAEGEINGPCRVHGHRDTGRGVCAHCGEIL